METNQEKPFYKKWWFILIVAVFIIGAIGSIFESDEKKQEREADRIAEEQKKEDEKKVKEEEKKEEEERIDNRSIDEALQEDENDVDKASLEDGTLRLENDVTTFWDETSILKLDVLKMFELLPDAFEDESVDRVRVILNVEMTDNKGNSEIEPVIYYEYTREHFSELEYDNFLNMATSQTWRILNESTSYEIHPGIYKNIDDDYKNNLNTGLSKIEE